MEFKLLYGKCAFSSYHRPALLGSEVVCDATLQKLGKQMAYMEMIITDKKTGKLLATGNHTKFL